INGTNGGTNGTTVESATANLSGATISDKNGTLSLGGSFVPSSNNALQTGDVSTGTINVGAPLTVATQATVTLSNTTASGDINVTASTLRLPGSPLVQTTGGGDINISGTTGNNLTIVGTD